MKLIRMISPVLSTSKSGTSERCRVLASQRVWDRARHPSHSPSRYSKGAQHGMIVTLTVVILLSIGLLLLLGPFEMARATWLLSQSD